MSKDIRTDHEYQNAMFGDFGFRIITTDNPESIPGERFSSIMALSDCFINITSTRNGDAMAGVTLLRGMTIYGDLAINDLSGIGEIENAAVIAYLRGE